MNEKQRLCIYSLYIQRAQCYLFMALKFQKNRYAKLSLEDCEFLNPYKFDLEKLENKILFDDLKRIENNAKQFIENRTNPVAANQHRINQNRANRSQRSQEESKSKKKVIKI